MQIWKQMFCPWKSYSEFKDYGANSSNPDKAAHSELPHLDLHCLQIQLFILFGAWSGIKDLRQLPIAPK